MQIQRINQFLREIAAHNDRSWFNAHKAEYETCKADFEEGVAEAIAAISAFDPEISQLTPKDCCYRFYRDIRFSPDKSPYKRHFGAYICAHGKKSLRAGYYLHVQPGRSLISAGVYWLPTPILTSIRNEMMGNIGKWREAVEDGKFVALFGYPNAGQWADGMALSEKGFGMEHLKTAPRDFPKDYPFLQYLKMKDFAAWRRVGDDFFEGNAWTAPMVDVLKTAKPMMDFLNGVIDDYE